MGFSRRQLALRSARFYWKHHLVTFLAVMVCAAVLTGALMVGQAMRGSLEQRRLDRLGKVEAALFTGDRFFRAALGESSGAVPAIRLNGSIASGDRKVRVHQVQVLSVPTSFWGLAAGEINPPEPGLVLNQRLATRLGAAVGDKVLLRVANPSALPREAVFSSDDDSTVALPGTVTAIIGPESMGDFHLEANPVPPFTVFLPLGGPLEAKLKRPGQANLLLAAEPFELAGMQLEDVELYLDQKVNLKSRRIFLGEGEETLVRKSGLASHPVLTYFVNKVVKGNKSSPFAMITASDLLDIKPGEIVLDSWIADPQDLGALLGDDVALSYFTLGEARNLDVHTEDFRVVRIIPKTEDLPQDDGLVTEFPGFEGKENCRDWDPNLPIDLGEIRDRDEEYWDAYGPSPKAFVSIEDGQRMWKNAYGQLTAVRFVEAADLKAQLEAHLDPADFGYAVRDLGAEGRASAKGTMDFGGLFLSMSWFLMIAAILLAVLQVGFSLDYRSGELELVRTLGFRPGRARGLVLMELIWVLVLGALLGGVLGYVYLHLVMHGLNGAWLGVGASGLLRPTGNEWQMIGVGALTVVLILLLVLWRGIGRRVKRVSKPVTGPTRGWLRWVIAGLSGAALVGLFVATPEDPAKLSAHFSSIGMMALVFGLAVFAIILPSGRSSNLWGLARRNLARRPGRTLAVAAMLAAGGYLVFSTGVFKRGEDVAGTGGFALIAQSTQPVYRDLNTATGREAVYLDDPVFSNGVNFVQLRVSQGVEASCLNLQAAQQPVVAGVNPMTLTNRFAIAKGAGWESLNEKTEDGLIPAIGDLNALQWALHKKVGDEVEVGAGRVQIVGAVNFTVLQGYLLVSEAHFKELFPELGGWQWFLIDTPAETRDEVAGAMTESMRDLGMEVRPAGDRLAELNGVMNAYIDIFQTLGGLGVMLGCLGLGILCVRNLLERRRELALLQAVGYSQGRLLKMLLLEQGVLLGVGLLVGVGAGLLAVIPFYLMSGSSAPPLSLAVIAVGALVLGMGSVVIGARWFLRQPIADNLRAD